MGFWDSLVNLILTKYQAFILSSIITSCSMDPLPKSGIPIPPHAIVHPRMPGDHLSGVKHMPVVSRCSAVYPQSQIPDICYDTRLPPSGSPYDSPQYPAGMDVLFYF